MLGLPKPVSVYGTSILKPVTGDQPMKNRRQMWTVGVLLLVFVAWTGYAQGQRPSPASPAWEYHVDPVPLVSEQYGIQPPAQEAALMQRLLNQRATEGWELAAVDASYFYFRRSK